MGTTKAPLSNRNDMSLNSHLTTTASALIIADTERVVINRHLEALRNKLLSHFPLGTFKERFEFGSYTRNTLMPRRADEKSDVDFMVVFNDDQHQPATYISKLKTFAEAKYASSEIYQSHPTIVLELSKIIIELVPARKSDFDNYEIPAPSNNYSTWLTTHPNAFNTQLSSKNTQENGLIRPIIRLMKYWNALNNWVYSSFELETLIVNHYYGSPTNLIQYFSSFVNSLTTFNLPTYKADKVSKLKRIVSEAIELDRNQYPLTAENKLKEVLPSY